MRRPISSSRRGSPLLGAVLALVLASLPAFAQPAGRDTDSSQDSSKTSRTEKRPAPDVSRPTPPDVSRPPRADAQPAPAPDASKARPLPPADAPPAPTRKPQPSPAPQPGPTPQPGSPAAPSPQPSTPVLQPRPDLIRPRPDLTRPRQDTPAQSRPDVSRPPQDNPAQPRPDPSLRIRQEIARPDRPRGPELSGPANAPLPASVQINTLAIIATNKDNRIDPTLRDLAAQLKPTFKFSGYRLAQSDASSVAPGQPAVLRLAGSYSLQVIPTEADAEHVVLNVQAMQDTRRVLSLQVRLRPGRYQLLGGWPVADGTLLAAVAAHAGE